MEEQNKVIKAFLDERKIEVNGLTKRQMNDLGLVFNAVNIMKEVLVSNEITVKNVAERTRKKDSSGHSISLATYYNNNKLLYSFVEFLKPENNANLRDDLEKAEIEISRLKEINSKLIRRDIKAEAMQAEIDALRMELRRLKECQELSKKEIPDTAPCIIRTNKAKS